MDNDTLEAIAVAAEQTAVGFRQIADLAHTVAPSAESHAADMRVAIGWDLFAAQIRLQKR